MQNLSNYSNSYHPPQRNVAFTSIENLQNHITELTLYINETNHKYNKNMHTLKQFYEEQISQLQAERNDMSDQIGGLKNQVLAGRDIIANKSMRIRELENEVAQARESSEQSREKLIAQRRKIDQIYEEMSELRQNCHSQMQKCSKAVLSCEGQISNLKISNQQKDSQVASLNQKIYLLQDQLSDRYSLPEKIKDIQRENEKLKTALQINKRRLLEVQEKMDYNQTDLEKYRKENESLRILKGKFNAEKSLQIEQTIKQQKENAEHRIRRLQAQNQGYVYQLNQSESQLKSMRKQISQLQLLLGRQKQAIVKYQKDINSININKDAYISQFGQLKVEYQSVIRRLQDSLIDYQKKNWSLEQENKELNDQLESLQQLLRELKAINNLQPARKQYRKLAQMEVLASRPASKPAQISPPQKPQVELPFESDYSKDWQKLLLDIEKIKM